MSIPATSCARRCELTASSYCSRKRELTIASRKLRRSKVAVYQCGRGNDPMMDVGSTILEEPLNIEPDLVCVAEVPSAAVDGDGAPLRHLPGGEQPLDHRQQDVEHKTFDAQHDQARQPKRPVEQAVRHHDHVS